MSTSQNPILISGAGPAGLVLAIALRENGIPVRIIDKAPEFHTGGRGTGIQPRTMELLKLLGVFEEFNAAWKPTPKMRSYKFPGGKEPLETWSRTTQLDAAPSIPFPGTRMICQDANERILRTHLARYGTTVELNTELVDFQQDADGVSVDLICRADGHERSERVRVPYLVGTDGAHSIVRKTLNLSFLGESRTEGILVGDMKIDGLSDEFWHIWTKDKKTVMLRQRITGDPVADAGNFYFIGVPSDSTSLERYSDPAEARAFIHEVTERTDLVIGEFSWYSSFRPNMRMVDTFGVGRVFVAGDAAHVHSPTGGQGLNTGVQDSLNLAWKLAFAYKNIASSDLLSTYQEERVPVVKSMLSTVLGLHTKAMGGAGLNAGDRGPALLMLGINYRWSPLALDERSGGSMGEEELKARAYGGYDGAALCAGDRAPEAPELLNVRAEGELTSVFALLDVTRYTLLVFPGVGNHSRAEEAVKIARRYGARTVLVLSSATAVSELMGSAADFILIDTKGNAYDAYKVRSDELLAVAIRPDGYIGAIVLEPASLDAYFSKIHKGI